MKTIYIVTQEHHDYDSCDSTALIGTADKAVAEAKVAEMQARLAQKEINLEAVNSHIALWEKINPRPSMARAFTAKALPIFKGPKKKWTPEQREEYDAVVKLNRETASADARPFSEWAMARHLELEAFKQAFSPEAREDLYLNSDTTWEIYDIPYIE